ncbi:MAG: hypothetical protein ACI932_002060, partial [Paracoccaceae bacterium]
LFLKTNTKHDRSLLAGHESQFVPEVPKCMSFLPSNQSQKSLSLADERPIDQCKTKTNIRGLNA